MYSIKDTISKIRATAIVSLAFLLMWEIAVWILWKGFGFEALIVDLFRFSLVTAIPWTLAITGLILWTAWRIVLLLSFKRYEFVIVLITLVSLSHIMEFTPIGTPWKQLLVIGVMAITPTLAESVLADLKEKWNGF